MRYQARKSMIDREDKDNTPKEENEKDTVSSEEIEVDVRGQR